MSIFDVAEGIVGDAVEWVEDFGGQAAEQIAFVEGLAPGLLELGFRLLMHEIEGDDGNGGGHVNTPNTHVDSAQLILAEQLSHAYGTTDNIITQPDSITANLARAYTSVAPDNWSDAWSLVIDSLGSPEENPTTFAEGTLDTDYASTLSDAVPTELALPADPIADAFLSVHEASTSVWTSALLS
jgi:hypothetical protein